MMHLISNLIFLPTTTKLFVKCQICFDYVLKMFLRLFVGHSIMPEMHDLTPTKCQRPAKRQKKFQSHRHPYIKKYFLFKDFGSKKIAHSLTSNLKFLQPLLHGWLEVSHITSRQVTSRNVTLHSIYLTTRYQDPYLSITYLPWVNCYIYMPVGEYC